MKNIAAIVAFVLFISAVLALLIWLDHRKRRLAQAAAVRFLARLKRPDFAGLEQMFQHPMPGSFRDLYEDQELVLSENICIAIPDPADPNEDCFIAFSEPADIETAQSVWPQNEELLPIANNGAGDSFNIDPRETDPIVSYFFHESDERVSLNVTLSHFVRVARDGIRSNGMR